jgi:hypothetical protein
MKNPKQKIKDTIPDKRGVAVIGAIEEIRKWGPYSNSEQKRIIEAMLEKKK